MNRDKDMTSQEKLHQTGIEKSLDKCSRRLSVGTEEVQFGSTSVEDEGATSTAENNKLEKKKSNAEEKFEEQTVPQNETNEPDKHGTDSVQHEVSSEISRHTEVFSDNELAENIDEPKTPDLTTISTEELSNRQDENTNCFTGTVTAEDNQVQLVDTSENCFTGTVTAEDNQVQLVDTSESNRIIYSEQQLLDEDCISLEKTKQHGLPQVISTDTNEKTKVSRFDYETLYDARKNTYLKALVPRSMQKITQKDVPNDHDTDISLRTKNLHTNDLKNGVFRGSKRELYLFGDGNKVSIFAKEAEISITYMSGKVKEFLFNFRYSYMNVVSSSNWFAYVLVMSNDPLLQIRAYLQGNHNVELHDVAPLPLPALLHEEGPPVADVQVNRAGAANQIQGAQPDQPGNNTADQPGNNTADKPGNDTADQPENDTAHQPGNDTAEQPGNDTADQPGNDTADQPGNDTAEQPGNDTADQPGNDTADQPGNDTADQPGNDTADQPGIDTADQPGNDTADQPGNDTAEQPGNDTADQPGNDIADQPGNDTAEQPGNDTADQPGNDTADQPGKDTADQPGNDTADKPGNDTAVKPGNDTADQPGNDTADKPGNDTADQPGNDTADQPGNDTADKPGNDTADQPGNDTADQPGNDTADQPGNDTAD